MVQVELDRELEDELVVLGELEGLEELDNEVDDKDVVAPFTQAAVESCEACLAVRRLA